jgi:murein L,D-transpeptidase YcbB/YkuD
MVVRLAAVSCVLASFAFGASNTGHARPAWAGHLQETLRTAHDRMASRLPAGEARDLRAFYDGAGWTPAWTDASGRPTTLATRARLLLDASAAEGLNPLDYETARPGSSTAEVDVTLTAALVRYYRHIHLGRIDPRSLGLQLTVPAEGHDFAAMLRAAQASGRLAETAADLEPRLAQYQALKRALAHYRRLAIRAPAARPLTLPTPAVRPNDSFADSAHLRELLTLLGDLPAGGPVPQPPATEPPRYAGAIVDGVRRFQTRHGLEADGVIGRATREAMTVPLEWRVRQIEMALERLRWLPDLSSGRLLAVNIPMFRLWAFDSVPADGPAALEMAVIVGRAFNTRTPVFADRMEHVIFRPYWNIPRSIVRNEILPAARRDPGYLARQDMQVVRGESDNSPVVGTGSEALALAASGAARIRQRPGPRNALGLVKFIFPNDNNVYMHATPAPLLFQRARRDLSHGCIRLENPAGLAEWVLSGMSGWTRERIDAAMNNGPDSQRVDLPDPIQVVIFYTTAAVIPGTEEVHFADDLYGQDAPLDRALQA